MVWNVVLPCFHYVIALDLCSLTLQWQMANELDKSMHPYKSLVDRQF